MRRVELGLDLGELEDEPEALWELLTLASVACGGHAGDDASMRACARRARGKLLLAHPSYPDREGFGRRSLAMPLDALTAAVREQCAALARVAALEGAEVAGVKPHGALYHDAARDPEIARAMLSGVREALGGVGVVVAPPGGAFARLATEMGARVLLEGFADRGYDERGGLVPRGSPGAMVLDPAAAAAQAARLAERHDVICLHGDAPGVLARARAVREALSRGGWLPTPGGFES